MAATMVLASVAAAVLGILAPRNREYVGNPGRSAAEKPVFRTRRGFTITTTFTTTRLGARDIACLARAGRLYTS